MAVRKYIFRPLEMKNSGFDFKNLSNKNKTTGYSVFSGETKKN
jgi:CubicO group peptidase (beta-lactamase class C family)